MTSDHEKSTSYGKSPRPPRESSQVHKVRNAPGFWMDDTIAEGRTAGKPSSKILYRCQICCTQVAQRSKRVICSPFVRLRESRKAD